MTDKQRQEIANKYFGRMCLLDGRDAKICGRLNKFASICPLDSFDSVEFSWETVKRIMDTTMVFSK